jgi:hypothetical protein
MAALIGGELDQVPSQLRPFMEKAGKDAPHQQVMMTMSYMAYAYGRAFEEFAIEAVKDWPKKDYVAQPMCYLVRHSMELHLKWAVAAYQDYLGNHTAKTDHHNLMRLWNTLTKLRAEAGATANDEYAAYIFSNCSIVLMRWILTVSSSGTRTPRMDNRSISRRSNWRDCSASFC